MYLHSAWRIYSFKLSSYVVYSIFLLSPLLGTFRSRVFADPKGYHKEPSKMTLCRLCTLNQLAKCHCFALSHNKFQLKYLHEIHKQIHWLLHCTHDQWLYRAASTETNAPKRALESRLIDKKISVDSDCASPDIRVEARTCSWEYIPMIKRLRWKLKAIPPIIKLNKFYGLQILRAELNEKSK